jgi:3-oxoacyl-[acyl-carrier protein] reductase
MDNHSIKNKNVIITGCNKGIGKATLECFAKSGANIFACIRSNDKNFKNFVSQLKKKYKIKINTIQLDLSNKSSILKCIDQINKVSRDIDIVINNAGMLFNSLFLMTSEKQIKQIFEVNYFSQIYFTQMILKGMIKKKSGNIIFVSSTSGINGDYGRFAYSSTKAAIINTAKTLSKELSSFNIRVNSISPGLTDTDLMKQNTKENIIQEEVNKISLKRVASVNEIAKTILFLASENSSYINGQNIIVDGGYL